MTASVYLSLLFRNIIQHLDCFANGRHIGHHHRALAILFAKVAAAHVSSDIIKNLTERLTLIERASGIADEVEEHTSLLQHDLLAAQMLATSAQANHL